MTELLQGPRVPFAEHLITGRDPWLKQAEDKAQRLGVDWSIVPVNWASDDTGLKVFSPANGVESRQAYTFTDAITVGPPLESLRGPAQGQQNGGGGCQLARPHMAPMSMGPKWCAEVPVATCLRRFYPDVARLAVVDRLYDDGFGGSAVRKHVVLSFPGRFVSDHVQQVEVCGRKAAHPLVNDRHTLEHRDEIPDGSVPVLHYSRRFSQAHVLRAQRLLAAWGGLRGHVGARKCAYKSMGIAKSSPYGSLPCASQCACELAHSQWLGLCTRGNDAMLARMSADDADLVCLHPLGRVLIALWNDTGPSSGQTAWKLLVPRLPKMPYTSTGEHIKWSALRLAGARKATTMLQVHFVAWRVHEYAYLSDPDDRQFQALVAMKEALLLVDKAFFVESAQEMAALRRMARDMYPKLLDLWSGCGGDAPNFRVRAAHPSETPAHCPE